MSEKNADVERAISAFGGLALTYHSFGPVVMRPRLSADTRPFTYNEMGEAEFATASSEALTDAALAGGLTSQTGLGGSNALGETYPVQAAGAPGVAARSQAGAGRITRGGDPLYDSLPIVQPPMARPVAAGGLASTPPPPMMSPLQPSASQPVRARPTLQPSHLHPAPAPSMPAMQPLPLIQAEAVQPAPPPFFPLLAAALPNATEPTYTPHYPAAAPPGFAGETGRGARAEPASAGVSMPAAAPDAQSADRRSLTEMFRLLQGRGDGGPAAPLPQAGVPFPAGGGLSAGGYAQGGAAQGGQAPAAPSPSFAAEGQALFRRI